MTSEELNVAIDEAREEQRQLARELRRAVGPRMSEISHRLDELNLLVDSLKAQLYQVVTDEVWGTR